MKYIDRSLRRLCGCITLVSMACLAANAASAAAPRRDARDAHVLLIVWDGLRPDMINAEETPNLAALRDGGVNFTDHHSTWPTLTMINASSFATGAFPGTHGYYGNWIWEPRAQGRNSNDAVVDFMQPVFTEDYGILQAIDAAQGGRLLRVPTLFEVAERAGLQVAVLGKGGPTFLQNRRGTTPFLDDRTVLPRSFADGLAAAAIPLPQMWSKAYPADPLPGSARNENPTAIGRIVTMKDGVTSDPTQQDGGPLASINDYYARVLTEYVLPKLRPQLAMLWLRNPDGTEHSYGPGSAATHAALRTNDALLGRVLARLEALGLKSITNIMIVSDHGHSHVSGTLDHFPLRAIRDGVPGDIDPRGFSVSGEVRSVDLLRRAGLLAYDGIRGICDPVMSGIAANGQSVYLHKPIDAQVDCKADLKVTGDFAVPGRLPVREPFAVVAPDGGSEYYYVPSHDRDFVARIVRFLQSRKQFGAIFVDGRRYGKLPGTLPLSAVRLDSAQGRNPDLIVSFNFDAEASISGVAGLEYTSAGSGRGSHGSFSPRDVHNTLIASGPAFRADLHRDELPTANVDVAPTIAAILGLNLRSADGRVLNEALRGARSQPRLTGTEVLRPDQPATALQILEPTDPDGKLIDPRATRYTIEVNTQIVRDGRREYRYFDSARAVRD